MSKETEAKHPEKPIDDAEEFERVVRTLDAAFVGVRWNAAAQAAAASLNKLANREGFVIQVMFLPSTSF